MKFQNKIDFHAHYLPKAYYDFLEEEGLYCPDGFPTPEWDEAWQQEAMGELGISYALLSISSPSLYTGNKFRSRELTRKVNEQGAEIVEILAFSPHCRCPMSTAASLRHGTA